MIVESTNVQNMHQSPAFAKPLLPAVVGSKKYSVIYADPAWKYNNQSPPCLPEKQPDTCKIEYYYPTMTIQEIKDLKVKEMCEKDCVLLLLDFQTILVL